MEVVCDRLRASKKMRVTGLFVNGFEARKPAFGQPPNRSGFAALIGQISTEMSSDRRDVAKRYPPRISGEEQAPAVSIARIAASEDQIGFWHACRFILRRYLEPSREQS